MSSPSSKFPVPGSQFLVLGFGNSLRTDDGVGQVVAARMAADPRWGQVESVACHQLLPEHGELISQAAKVVFVDAAAGGEPGGITVREITADADAGAGRFHDFSPAALLAYADLLYGRSPTAVLITINGFSFDHGENLSPQMQALMPRLMQIVQDNLV